MNLIDLVLRGEDHQETWQLHCVNRKPRGYWGHHWVVEASNPLGDVSVLLPARKWPSLHTSQSDACQHYSWCTPTTRSHLSHSWVVRK